MSFLIKNYDCLEYIKELKRSKSELFDAVITDPPYNISRDNNFKTIGRAGIDFGNWDYGFDQTTWIREISPLIKKGGNIIIFNDYKNLGIISSCLEETGFEIKDLLRWIKNNPMPRNTSRRYVTDYEFAIWAVKSGDKWTFNKPKNKPYIRPEFKSSIVTTGKDKIHPTQKSLSVMEEIIKIHTNPGDLVYDPFMGSGTTGVACLKNERLFYGTEIDKKYFNAASNRLSQVNLLNISSKKVIRSPLYYLGDKYKIFPQIVDFFPKSINQFIDVFGGGGTVVANVEANTILYNDIDSKVTEILKYLYRTEKHLITKKINFWIKKFKLVKGNLNDKEENKKNFNLARDYLNNLKDKTNDEFISLLLTIIIFSFNNQIRFNSKENFNIPIGKQDFNDDRKKALVSFVNSIQNKKINFLSEDFRNIEYLKIIKSKSDFLYFDPPYSITNATYNTNWTEKDDEDLFDLLDFLHDNNIKWAMSNVFIANGKANLKLKKWAEKYYVNYLTFNYKNSNYQRKNLGNDQEVLITNYEN